MQPELLAYHCTEAGLAAQALRYWQQAGQKSPPALCKCGSDQPSHQRVRDPHDPAETAPNVPSMSWFCTLPLAQH